MTQNILGAGILALPFAFKSAGLAGGVLLLGLVYVLSVGSMSILVLLANHVGEFSYGGAANCTLGRRSSVMMEVWVLVYNLGICISYPILLGDFLFALAAYCELAHLTSKLGCMALAVLLICWPLSCAPSLGGLQWMSAIGIAGILFTSLAVMLRYADGTYNGPDRNNFAILEAKTFGSCFPILVGAFGAHYNIPSLYREVAPGAGAAEWGTTAEGSAAFRRMMKIICAAVTLSGLVYGWVGLVVYATFGTSTHSDFTENFSPADGWLVLVRLTMAFAICASFPLTMVSARNAAFNIALQPRGMVMSSSLRIMLTTALTALCLGLAAAAGDIGVVLAYNGSVFGTPVCYIAPAIMYLRLPRQHQKRRWRALCILSAGAGLVFGLLGVLVVSVNASRRPSR